MNIIRQLMDEPRHIPDYGEFIDAQFFIKRVRGGGFIPYDGCGYWMAEEYYDLKAPVWDKNGDLTLRPKWATHVAWFNK